MNRAALNSELRSNMKPDAVNRRQVFHGDLAKIEKNLATFFAAVWDDVIVSICGRSPDELDRESFVRAHCNPIHPATEWRFSGSLGFGGKFWCQSKLQCDVNCYPEDETPERLETMKKANEALKALIPEIEPSELLVSA